MKVLDQNFLNRLVENREKEFEGKTYPWFVGNGFFQEGKYKQIIDESPDLESILVEPTKKPLIKMFSTDFDEFMNHVPFTPLWQDFMNDINSEAYKNFISNLFDIDDFKLMFTFMYAKNGYFFGLHPDGNYKKCANVFYLFDERTWKEEYGGRTIYYEGPAFTNSNDYHKTIREVEEIDKKTYVNGTTVEASILKRTNNSWHAIEEINSPYEGFARKTLMINAVEKNYSLKELPPHK